MTMLRARLGYFRIGLRIEKLPHTIVIRSLFSHVADTVGILNKFSNTDRMCMFLDLDDKVSEEQIIREVLPELMSDKLDYILMQTSTGHNNIICPNLITKDQLDILMLKYLKYMDYRFVYVYQRDGCNAIRMTPKIIDGVPIKWINVTAQGWNAYNPQRHLGLIFLLYDLFNINPPFPIDSRHYDFSTKSDLIERRYETINW